ncbi:MAG: hypothetical protein U1E78_08415 [Gammaproteobacteria bacterium]
MLEVHQLVRIFCEIDDFCKQLENYTTHLFLTGPSKPKRGPSCRLSISEIMTILILFQMIRFRDFKTFYNGFLMQHYKHYFPDLPSYNRFIELIPRAIFPMT